MRSADEIRDERTARLTCVALPAAKLCYHCMVVGEETAVGRCPACGCRKTMASLLKPETLEVLVGMALDRAPKEMTVQQMAVQAKARELERLLLVCRGDYGATAAAAGCHRNTVQRILGPKRARMEAKAQRLKAVRQCA